MKKEPKIGDKIYVPSSFYVYRGEDDFVGGTAIISEVDYDEKLPKDHYNYIMVAIENRPFVKYNWNNLLENQEKWEKIYAGSISHPCPDMRPEFNDNNADWK